MNGKILVFPGVFQVSYEYLRMELPADRTNRSDPLSLAIKRVSLPFQANPSTAIKSVAPPSPTLRDTWHRFTKAQAYLNQQRFGFRVFQKDIAKARVLRYIAQLKQNLLRDQVISAQEYSMIPYSKMWT